MIRCACSHPGVLVCLTCCRSAELRGASTACRHRENYCMMLQGHEKGATSMIPYNKASSWKTKQLNTCFGELVLYA
jgi:hypothetical protein